MAYRLNKPSKPHKPHRHMVLGYLTMRFSPLEVFSRRVSGGDNKPPTFKQMRSVTFEVYMERMVEYRKDLAKYKTDLATWQAGRPKA
jgi:hypothetical protein